MSSGCSPSIRHRSERISMRPVPAKGGCRSGRVGALAVEGEGLGRSRGGLTSNIHLATDGRGCRCRSGSHPVKPATTRNCCRCWTTSRCAVTGQADRGNNRIGCSLTRPTRTRQHVESYGPGESRSPARNGGDQIASRKAKRSAGGRPPDSTPRSIGGATESSAASPGSNSSATSPPATPNASPTGDPNSSSPPSSSGSDDLQDTPYSAGVWPVARASSAERTKRSIRARA